MSEKDDYFDDAELDDQYLVSGDTVAEIVLSLLHLVVAFVGVEKAKSLLSQIGVKQANELADEAEKKKFGN